jgi:hypothetical protein
MLNIRLRSLALAALLLLLPATLLAQTPITWENLTLITQVGTEIKKTNGANEEWDAMATSQQTITDGSFTWIVTAGGHFRVGLSNDTTDPASIPSHYFQFFGEGAENATIRTSGGGVVAVTDLVVGDTFGITIASGVVSFTRNGSVVHVAEQSISGSTKLKYTAIVSNSAISTALANSGGGGGGGTPGTYTVCASGCNYGLSALQQAINAVPANSTILLQEGYTFIGDFSMPVKAGAGASAWITIRTGVNATGTVQASSRYTPEGVRICPSTYSVDWYNCAVRLGSQDTSILAKIQPATNNAYAIRTANSGSGTPVSYYRWELIHVIPNNYAGNSLVGITNETAPANGDPTTMLPHHIVLDRMVIGQKDVAQFRGVQIDGNDIQITNSHIVTQHTGEGQTVWCNTSIGPILIDNNYLSGGTEVFLCGGGGTTIHPTFTVQASPSPTTTVFTLNAATDLYAGKSIAVMVGSKNVTSIDTSATSLVTTSASHGYAVGYQVVFSSLSGCTAAVGTPQTITAVPSSTTFRIASTCATSGSGGTVAVRAHAEIASIATNAVTVTPALPIAPVSGVETSLVVRNMTITNNVMTRPSAWRTSNPSGWQVKNTFELKHGRDSTIEGNIIENSWQAGQAGPCVVLTATQQNAEADSAVIRNVTFQRNVIRNCMQFIQIAGTDALGHESARSGAITFTDNLFYGVGQPYGTSYGIIVTHGGGPRQTPNRQPDALTFEHNTFHAFADADGPSFSLLFNSCHDASPAPSLESTSPNSLIRNNIIYNGQYGLGSIGITQANCADGTTAGRLQAPLGSGSSMIHNVIVGGICTLYDAPDATESVCPERAAFEANAFTGTSTVGGFKVKSSSTYYAGAASDATDNESMGADIAAIEAELLITESGAGAAAQPIALNIATESPLPTAYVGQAYSYALEASGGTAPYTWAITSGTIPAGLTLNTSTGAITGTPTTAVTNRSLTFRVTDAVSAQVSEVKLISVVRLVTRPNSFGYKFNTGVNYGPMATPPNNPEYGVKVGDTYFDTTTGKLMVATQVSPTVVWTIVGG